MQRTSDPCKRCLGRGMDFIPIIQCTSLDEHEFCEDHYQHFVLGRACWLCLGSGRASKVEIWWRQLRERVWRLWTGKGFTSAGSNLP